MGIRQRRSLGGSEFDNRDAIFMTREADDYCTSVVYGTKDYIWVGSWEKWILIIEKSSEGWNRKYAARAVFAKYDTSVYRHLKKYDVGAIIKRCDCLVHREWASFVMPT